MIVLARAGPFFHALTFLAIDATNIDGNKGWMLALMFPAIVAFLGLLVSFANPY